MVKVSAEEGVPARILQDTTPASLGFWGAGPPKKDLGASPLVSIKLGMKILRTIGAPSVEIFDVRFLSFILFHLRKSVTKNQV
jgi:hypothetical protein